MEAGCKMQHCTTAAALQASRPGRQPTGGLPSLHLQAARTWQALTRYWMGASLRSALSGDDSGCTDLQAGSRSWTGVWQAACSCCASQCCWALGSRPTNCLQARQAGSSMLATSAGSWGQHRARPADEHAEECMKMRLQQARPSQCSKAGQARSPPHSHCTQGGRPEVRVAGRQVAHAQEVAQHADCPEAVAAELVAWLPTVLRPTCVAAAVGVRWPTVQRSGALCCRRPAPGSTIDVSVAAC